MALLRALSPNQETKKVFSNELPNDFRAYIRFKCGSRDGQNLGQPAMWGSARHWGQLAMFGLSQEHLLNPKADVGILTFLLATSWCCESSFHLGVRLPKGSIFLILSFHGIFFGSSCSAPVVFRLHISTSIHCQHTDCVQGNWPGGNKISDWWKNPQNVFLKASHYFLQELLPIECSQALKVQARLTISTPPDHIKGLLKILQWLEAFLQ